MLITGLLRRAAQLHGDKIALSDGERSLSWADLVERAARLAGGLLGLGLKRGDRVAILSRNSIAFHDAYVALPWAGLIMTCLNIRWSLGEIVDAINDSEATALLVDSEFFAIANDLATRCPSLKIILAAGDSRSDAQWDTLATTGEPIEDQSRDAHDLAYIFYTGGTTGRSKGVMLSHLNFFSAALMRVFTGEFSEQSVIALSLPMFHISGSAFVGANLAAAARLELLPSFEPISAMASVQRRRVTHVGWVPTMFSMILNHPDFKSYDLSSLHRVFYGAAPMQPSLIRQAVENLPAARFVQYYGMTETVGSGTWLAAFDHDPSNPERLLSVGRAVPGMETKIRVLREDGSPAMQNEIGEVCLRGAMVTSGYWRQPQATADALQSGWLFTGDVGRIDEHGYLFLVDRLKDMIITGGENVYSNEVENVVFAHPAVRECAVIGIPDEKWGEIVCAVVYADPEAKLAATELQEYCRKQIGGYKIPRRVIFSESPLPKSAAGKILKTELRRMHATPAEKVD